MRNDRAVLCREVLKVLNGILERKLEAENAKKRDRALEPTQKKRRRKRTTGVPGPLASRTSPAG